MTDKTREAWETELLAHEPSGKPQLWFTRKEVVSIISAATARAMAEAVRVCEGQEIKAPWAGVPYYNHGCMDCADAIKEALK